MLLQRYTNISDIRCHVTSIANKNYTLGLLEGAVDAYMLPPFGPLGLNFALLTSNI